MSNIVIAGDTSGSVTLQAPAVAGGTVVTLPATTGTAALTSDLLGVGQTWQDVTAIRTIGVTYTNSTGKPIQVVIYGGGASTISINGTTMFSTPAGLVNTSFIVPNGGTYAFSSGGSIGRWSELR